MKNSRVKSQNPCARILAFGTAALVVASTASAQTVTVGPGPAEVNFLHDFNNGVIAPGSEGFALPTTTLNTVINNARTVVVDSAIGVEIGSIQVSNNVAGTAESALNIETNGSLTTGVLTIGGNGAPGAVNVTGGDLTTNGNVNVGPASGLNITDGSLSVNGAINVNSDGTVDVTGGALSTTGAINVNATGTFNLSAGTVTNTGTGARVIFGGGADGVVNITGGAFTATADAAGEFLFLNGNEINVSGGTVALTGGQVLLQANTTFSVIGSDADIDFSFLNASVGSTYNFVFDEDGVSAIDVSGFALLGNAAVSIDLSAFTGADGEFVLIDSANLAGLLSLDNLSITGLGDSLEAVFVQDVDTDNVSIQVTTIPEPATLSLALMGAGLAFGRRRRR